MSKVDDIFLLSFHWHFKLRPFTRVTGRIFVCLLNRKLQWTRNREREERGREKQEIDSR